MIFNTPALDYWRATTSRLEEMDSMSADLVPREMDGENWRFLQYSGKSFGGLHVGSAIQNGQPSYIVEASGETADDLWPSLKYSDMKVTRLDLQITIPKPDYWDSVEYHFEMELGEWPKGIARDVQTRLNKGNDTIYVGDRTSQVYIRVYVKDVNYVRFEVEYKKAKAVDAWKIVRNGGRLAVAGLLMAEIKSLPDSPFLEDCRAVLLKWTDVSISIPLERKKSTDISKLRWLASLLNTVEKMMNDSDYGDMVLGWFVDMTSRAMERRFNDEK